jgi:hypothetical protein
VSAARDAGQAVTAGARRVSRRHRALLVVPFVWQVGLAPFVNEVAWQPWSLPFPMVWQMAGVVLTTLVIAVVYALDRRIDGDRPEHPP